MSKTKLNEGFGLGELPSSKLIKMKVSLKDLMPEGDGYQPIPGKVYDNPYATAFQPVDNTPVRGMGSTDTFKTDYDHEGSMARTQLEKCIDHSEMLRNMISDDAELPAWVQAKLTKAADYLQSVYNYMDGKDGMQDDGDFRKKELIDTIRNTMNEKIRKVDDGWAVYPSKGGERLGTHSTKRDALKQLAAIEINKQK